MIAVQEFAGKAVGVFGLARSGLSAARALQAGGAKLYAWDDGEAAREAAAKEKITLEPRDRWPWQQIKTLVLSPGIPLTHPEPHPVVRQAKNAGAEVIGDVELFARAIRGGREKNGAARVIAVTGTNGKSTTTALIGHVLQSAGLDAQVGGNIGKPVLDLKAPTARTIYVLELSSYQIELSPGLDARRGGAHQSLPRSSRPARFDGELRSRQRVAAQARGAGRSRRGRRRRRLFRGDLHQADGQPDGRCRCDLHAQGAGPRHLRHRRKIVRRLGSAVGAYRRSEDRRSSSGKPQLAERRTCLCGRAPDHPRPARHLLVHSPVSRSGASHRRGRAYRQDPLRQRFQGDKRRCRSSRAGLFLRHLLDCRRQGEGRRHRRPRAVFSTYAQSLSDRRSGGRLRPDARGQGCHRAIRHARTRAEGRL